MSGPAIEMRQVSLAFDGVVALEEVDLRVSRGAFLGIIGPNGGGKTVLLKLIVGLLEPDQGVVRVLGMPPKKARGRIAYVPQYAQFDRTFPMRVGDAVLGGRLRPGLLGRYSAEDRRHASAALAQMGLEAWADKQLCELSGGLIQRVLIARALAVKAEILLLDEPTASLDPKMAAQLYDLLVALTPALTVVLISHDIGVMHQHVESVACLNRRLHYHNSEQMTQEVLDGAYGYPVDVVLHPHSHRVLGRHE